MNLKIISQLLVLIFWIGCSTNHKPEQIQNRDLSQKKYSYINDSIIKYVHREIKLGNLFYFDNENHSSRFDELLWKKYSIISSYIYKEGPFDNFFALIMNSITIRKVGNKAIQDTYLEADSIDKYLSFTQNLDSSYNIVFLKPQYPGPGGCDYLKTELILISDSVESNTEIWIDGVIDTNGRVTNVEIIRKGCESDNRKVINKITKHLLTFTPAYIIIGKVSSNPIILKLKKVPYKTRFYCPVVTRHAHTGNCLYPVLKHIKIDSVNKN